MGKSVSKETEVTLEHMEISEAPQSPKAKKQGDNRKDIRRTTSNKRYHIKRSTDKPEVRNHLAQTRKFKASFAKENISLKELKTALTVLKRRKTSLPDFISSVKEMQVLERDYGKPYGAIVEDYDSKIDLVAKATARLKDMEELEINLEAGISNLEELQALEKLLCENGVALETITEYVRQYKRLRQFGFEIGTVKLIAEELKRLRIDPREAGKIVGNWFTKYGNTSEALLRVEKELQEARKEEALEIARIKSLDRKTEEAQKKIDSLENYYVRRSESLESEYNARERILDSRYVEERVRAEAELFDILRDRDKLRSENRVLKEEIETIKRDIDLARSLSMIIRDPKSLSSSQLDILVSEFTRAKEARTGQGSSNSSSSQFVVSSNRLIEARRVLASALSNLPSLEDNSNERKHS